MVLREVYKVLHFTMYRTQVVVAASTAIIALSYALAYESTSGFEKAWIVIALSGLSLVFAGVFVKENRAMWLWGDWVLCSCMALSPFLISPFLITYAIGTIIVASGMYAYNSVCCLTNKAWKSYHYVICTAYSGILGAKILNL